MMDVKRALNDVGSAVFVKYYYDFKTKSHAQCMESIVEDYTVKSKSSRTTKAQKLFAEKQNLEALRIIIASERLDPSIIRKAKELFDAEQI